MGFHPSSARLPEETGSAGLRFRSRTARWARALLVALLLGMVTVQQPAGSQAAPSGGIVRLGYSAAQSEFDAQAEGRILELLNQLRLSQKVPPVVMDARLQRLARAHSRDMAMRGYVGHDSPEKAFLDRIGQVVPPGTFVGENVTVAQTAEHAFRAFAASPPHRQNMLRPQFRRVGIGVATAGRLGIMVTQDFSE